jgi:hypothetical protein
MAVDTSTPEHATVAVNAPAAPAVNAPGVMVQLALLVSAARAGALSGVDSEQALRVVEAVETVKAWADSVSMAATSAMVARFETDFGHLAPENPRAWAWTRFLRTCRSAAAREIQVATGLPVTQCQRRVWLAACDAERVAPVRAAMKAGRLTFTRAAVLTEATAHLDAVTAATIATRVLRPLTGPDGVPLPGMAPLSQATFTARLRTQLVLANGLVGEAARTYAEALKARRLSAEPHPDGTGVLFLSGDGARVTAAAGRVDRIARRLRKAGDSRTLVQLRADVATDLLLRGWIPNDPTFAQLGESPAATVNLVVSLATLLGADRGVGQIPGWGAVSAQQARRLALAAGSIWKRVVTDPLTGRAIEAAAGTYRVPAAMAEQVTIRDGTCRAPGCEIPAQGTDLDHTIEWTTPAGDTDADTSSAGGTTAETNLAALHRGHHNLKTSGFWDSNQSPDGTLRWTTAAGRKVTTYPYVYDHPDSQPVNTSSLEARLGRRVAHVINPAIPLPAHLSVFDEISWAASLAPATPEPPPHQWPARRQSEPPTGWAAALSGPPPF